MDIVEKVRPYSMLPEVRLRKLLALADQVEYDKIPGDIVECGVANGGSGALLAFIATHSAIDRKVWLLDTFKGMPRPTMVDGIGAFKHEGLYSYPVESIIKTLKVADADVSKVRIVPGFYKDTFAQVTPEQIALLHIDCDWYESVKLVMETFFDRVAPGGFVVIDDYGYWMGCRKAVDEFFAKRGIYYEMNAVDHSGYWFRKSAVVRTDLCKLAIKYGTDKANAHEYTRVYHGLLNERRNSVKKVLELGIGYPGCMYPSYKIGASLRMWRDYFPKAMIYAFDNEPSTMFSEERIQTFLANQILPVELIHVAQQLGGEFDLIVDDASHIGENQAIAMKALLPFLAPQGIYVVEDVYDDTSVVTKEVPLGYVFDVPSCPGQAAGKLVVVKHAT